MQIKFNIQETTESEIYYGSYVIYILGGHYIETNPDFYIQIVNIETNENIQLTEKSLKGRDYKFGKKAIKFYTFNINDYGKFKISAHNYEDIVVKESILQIFPFPFSIPGRIMSFVLGRSIEKMPINTIEIGIE